MIGALVLALAVAVTPSVTPLPGNAALDYQLGGASPPAAHMDVVVRDRNAAPAAGRYHVCYVNGFQSQPDEAPFWRKRWSLVLKRNGRPVVGEAWGEWVLDIRTPAKRKRLGRVVGRWIDRCAREGYDAVELDNLDSFSRSRGLVSRGQAKAFAKRLVRRAHRAGLAVGQKNWAELDGRPLGFDFAIAEECGRYRECGDYVLSYGARVLVIEYRRKDFRRACRSHGDRLGIVLRDRALRPGGRRVWC